MGGAWSGVLKIRPPPDLPLSRGGEERRGCSTVKVEEDRTGAAFMCRFPYARLSAGQSASLYYAGAVSIREVGAVAAIGDAAGAAVVESLAFTIKSLPVNVACVAPKIWPTGLFCVNAYSPITA